MYYNESFFSVLNHNLLKINKWFRYYHAVHEMALVHFILEKRLPRYHGFLVMHYGIVMVFLESWSTGWLWVC